MGAFGEMISPVFLASNTTEPIVNGGGQHYIPSAGVSYTFLSLFIISTIVHLFQAIAFRKFFMIPTVVIGGLLEVSGWGARVWMSIEPMSRSAFIMQSTGLVLGPTPLVAANFVILGRIIAVLGPQFSRLTPKRYATIFCVSDVISLLVQGTGGGIAASAGDSRDKALLGSRITLTGTIFQLCVMILYAILKAEFLWRYARDRPVRTTAQLKNPMDRRIKLLTYALIFNTTCLIIRAIYRIIEFADGWDGRIVNTEIYFNVLDGMMVVLAIYTLNITHPGWFLPSQKLDSLSEPKLEMGPLQDGSRGIYEPVRSEERMPRY